MPNSDAVPRNGARRFDSPRQEAFLNLWHITTGFARWKSELFGRFDLTAQQYNSLRLLRAARPRRCRHCTSPGGLFRLRILLACSTSSANAD